MHFDLDRVRRLLPAIERGMRQRVPGMADALRRWPSTVERHARQWIPIVRQAPIPRRAVMIATALTTAAAVSGAAGHTTTDADVTRPAPLISVGGHAAPSKQSKSAEGAADAPSPKTLMPDGVQVPQQTFEPTPEQMANAEAIIAAGQQMDLPDRALVIAVATALQETALHNYGDLGARNDHDSQGLFQQRPSAGWGTPEQITDPNYAATQFYQQLVGVPGWQDMPLTEAAQTVQVSAFPDAYAKWEKQAAELVRASYGAGPYAQVAEQVRSEHKKSDGGEHGKSDKPANHDGHHRSDDKKKHDQPDTHGNGHSGQDKGHGNDRSGGQGQDKGHGNDGSGGQGHGQDKCHGHDGNGKGKNG